MLLLIGVELFREVEWVDAVLLDTNVVLDDAMALLVELVLGATIIVVLLSELLLLLLRVEPMLLMASTLDELFANELFIKELLLKELLTEGLFELALWFVLSSVLLVPVFSALDKLLVSIDEELLADETVAPPHAVSKLADKMAAHLNVGVNLCINQPCRSCFRMVSISLA